MSDSKEAGPADQVKAGARAESAAKAEMRTCVEWAKELGHTDPELVGRKPGDTVFIPKERPTSASFNGFKFAAAAAHAGWGTKLAIDAPMTREAYLSVVEAALALPVGESHQAKEPGR